MRVVAASILTHGSITGLSEIERETILYDRDREVQDLLEKDKLSARLKERNAQQAADARASAARRSEREAATPKLSAIQELKRKREAKSNKPVTSTAESSSKRSKRDYYSSEDEEEKEEEEEVEEEGVYSDEDDIDSPATRRTAEKEEDRARREADDLEGSKEISYEDALQIRISRKSCVKFMYYPQFPETAIGCFVRISIGATEGKPAYRVCQVSSMQEGKRPYKLPSGEQCKRALLCSHGSSDRTFEFTYVSDTAFTKEEFDQWCDTMQKDSIRIINKRKFKAKLKALKEMGDHHLTNAEINTMVEEKKKLSKIPPNVAAEKIRLSGLIIEARDNKKEARVEELQNELAKIEELTANRGRNGDLDRLSKLNERNRHQNLRAVGKAENENAEKRRQAERTGGAVGGDPFSRLKTRPRMFYESTPNSSAPGSPSLAPVNGAVHSSQGQSPSKRKLGGVDDLIGYVCPRHGKRPLTRPGILTSTSISEGTACRFLYCTESVRVVPACIRIQGRASTCTVLVVSLADSPLPLGG